MNNPNLILVKSNTLDYKDAPQKIDEILSILNNEELEKKPSKDLLINMALNYFIGNHPEKEKIINIFKKYNLENYMPVGQNSI